MLHCQGIDKPRQHRIALALNCSREIYSSGLCATAIEPGPHTTAGTPRSRVNSPPSVPKLILPVELPPVSLRTKLTASLSTGVSRAG